MEASVIRINLNRRVVTTSYWSDIVNGCTTQILSLHDCSLPFLLIASKLSQEQFSLRTSFNWTKTPYPVSCPFSQRQATAKNCNVNCINIKSQPLGLKDFSHTKDMIPYNISPQTDSKAVSCKNWSLPCFSSLNLNVALILCLNFVVGTGYRWLSISHHWLRPEVLTPPSAALSRVMLYLKSFFSEDIVSKKSVLFIIMTLWNVIEMTMEDSLKSDFSWCWYKVSLRK